MGERLNKVDIYLSQLEGSAREWNEIFINYMRQNYPDLEEVISFQMPTYKLGSGKERNYISFGVAKNHFSLHSMDFEYIAQMKEKLSKPGKGKGCVNIPFDKPCEREILFKAIDDIIERKITCVYGK